MFEQVAHIETELAPYEQIKNDLAATRARFRELTSRFVEVLKARCAALSDDHKLKLVLELFAQDVQSGLDAGVAAKRQSLIRFVERLWDKYAAPLSTIQRERDQFQTTLVAMMRGLRYT